MNVQTRAVIGVVGPADLVALVTQVAQREFSHLTVTAGAYSDEDETPAVVERLRGEVDAWLFTGIIPYTIAKEAGALDRPATHISYSGATLYRVLVSMLNRGHSIEAISVDTLERNQVVEALREAGLDVARVHVLPFRPSRTAETFAQFHRQSATEQGTTLAITCVRSVYSEIHNEMEAIRLSPALASVRTALTTLTLATAERVGSDAQVVIGYIDLPAEDTQLATDLASDAATLVKLDSGPYMIVTTKGALESATQGFKRLPLLDRLAQEHKWARIGFGIGRSAPEADALARQALARSRLVGPYVAIVALAASSELVMITDGSSPAHADDISLDEPASLGVAARRAGVERSTLIRIRDMISERGGGTITASEMASALGYQPRTARRILQRLERSGLAERVGSVETGATGRPPIVHRLRF